MKDIKKNRAEIRLRAPKNLLISGKKIGNRKDCLQFPPTFRRVLSILNEFSTTENGEGVGNEWFFLFYFLPTFLCNLIRNRSDTPFSLENDVRAVFHHRAHRDHREEGIGSNT
jgi:hypothetical protein